MSRPKYWLPLAIALAVLSFVLAACGGADDDSASAAAGSTPEAAGTDGDGSIALVAYSTPCPWRSRADH